MNQVDLERFRTAFMDCYRRFESALEKLELDWARKEGLPPDKLRGLGRERILEAQVRTYLLDPILSALGWNIGSPELMVVEDGVEPQKVGHRRFLDYHGRAQVEGTSARSLLVVEAKRASVTLPDEAPERCSLLVAKALTELHSEEPVTSVGGEWPKFLGTLVDYAKRVQQETGELPKVMALTNGDWFLVFEDVGTALLAAVPASTAIRIYRDHDEVWREAARFYRYASYESLAESIPPQPPEALRHFVTGPADKLEAVLAVDVSLASHGDDPDVQPSLAARILALVRGPGGRWLTFMRTYPLRKYVELHPEPDAQLREISHRADELLRDLRACADIKLLSAIEAEIVLKKQGGTRAHLRHSRNSHSIQLITGDVPFFVNSDTTWDGCPHHGYGALLREGRVHPLGRLDGPSVSPRVFFPPGSPMHCAHGAVYEERRRVDCIVAGVEQLLCCRKCTYFRRCYCEGETAALPCRPS